MATTARCWADLPETGATILPGGRESSPEVAADRSATNSRGGAEIPGNSVFSGRIERLADGFSGQDMGNLWPNTPDIDDGYTRQRFGYVGTE